MRQSMRLSINLSFVIAVSTLLVSPVVAQQVECSTESGLTAVAHAAPVMLRFRNHAAQPHIAGRAEQIWPNLAPFQLTDEDALRPALQRPGDVGLAQAQWQLSHAVAPRAEFPKA